MAVRAQQRARNRRLGLILIGAFAVMLVGSVLYVILFQRGLGA